MSGETSGFTLWSFIKGIGKFLIGLVLFLQGLLGLALLLLFVGFVIGLSSTTTTEISLPDRFALSIDPSGLLVEQRGEPDPVEILTEDGPTEIELQELVDAIRAAKDDDRVTALVLKLQEFYAPSSSASKLHYLANEIDDFKESGKPVLAVGDFYGQGQYLIASRADEIMVHSQGGVFIEGYGSYRLFYKSLLEKLEVTSNVFRVGAYKSYLEPVLRDDMSPEAEEANMAYLSVLWREYADSVIAARELDAQTFNRYVNEPAAILLEADGDMAQSSLNAGLVDAVATRDEMERRAREISGVDEDDDGRFSIGLFEYLRDVRSDLNHDGDDGNVGIVTASGAIVMGEQSDGTAGGDTIARLLRQAREDDNIKAVVLRVDSPGGSSFASEVIREQIDELQEAGKPVVASFGSSAASGGYWIAATADEIWAAPTTITGSIGIFGWVPTFENTFAKIGVYSDGVGTGPFSGSFNPARPLPEEAKRYIQVSIEDGYDDFLSLVAEGRNLERAYVEDIAQGRVWIGETAHELGLVDSVGYLDDAVQAAADRAGLDSYDVVRVRKAPTPFEQFLKLLSDNVDAEWKDTLMAPLANRPAATSAPGRFLKIIENEIAFFTEFDDPSGSYARCIACGF